MIGISSPLFKIGDRVYHVCASKKEGTIISYDNTRDFYEVDFQGTISDYWSENLRSIKQEFKDKQYISDSLNYALSNSQPETIRNTVDVTCDCGVESAGVGGKHSNWCKA